MESTPSGRSVSNRPKFETTLAYMPDNYKLYRTLLEKDFVPFIGAGLSAGIGVGSWNDLIYTLANRLFKEKYYNELFDIRNEKILLCGQDQELLNDCLCKLDTLDKEEAQDPVNAYGYIQQRIRTLKAFFESSIRYGQNQVDLQIKLFQSLMNGNQKYSAYEATELLDILDHRRDLIYQLLEEEINRNRFPNGSWQVSADKAAYWLPRIIRCKDVMNVEFRCITTNFDKIIEGSEPEIDPYVGHLHGTVDNRSSVCITLTDLAVHYKELLNSSLYQDPDSDVVTKINEGNFKRLPYVFMGTSFSEDHIGRIVRGLVNGTENYAIIGREEPPNRNELFKIRERVQHFGVGEHSILYYPISQGRHDALVDLLHQLFRDLSSGFWNNWYELDKLWKAFESSHNSMPCSEVFRALSWLQSRDRHALKDLTVKIGNENNIKVGQDHTNAFLTCNGYDTFSSFYYVLKEQFQLPQSCMCFVLLQPQMDDAYWNNNDLAPLGDTLYFVLGTGSAEEEGSYENFCSWLDNLIKMTPYDSLRCKIVRLILTREDMQKITYSYLNESISDRSDCRRPKKGNLLHDVFPKIIQSLFSSIYLTWNTKTQLSPKGEELSQFRLSADDEVALQMGYQKNNTLVKDRKDHM